MIAPLDLVAQATRMVLDEYAETEIPGAPTTSTRELRVLDPSLVSADLGPHGPVARAMQKVAQREAQRFEDRPTQRAMAEAVVRLYNNGGVGLLEAGTGVGKSLGYLIPALRWAAANGERTVVSTNTINLQEQLVSARGAGVGTECTIRPAQGLAQLRLQAAARAGHLARPESRR